MSNRANIVIVSMLIVACLFGGFAMQQVADYHDPTATPTLSAPLYQPVFDTTPIPVVNSDIAVQQDVVANPTELGPCDLASFIIAPEGCPPRPLSTHMSPEGAKNP